MFSFLAKSPLNMERLLFDGGVRVEKPERRKTSEMTFHT